MAKKSRREKDIQYKLEREIASLKNFSVKKYREFLKTGEEYTADNFKTFFKEPLSCLKNRFPFVKEDAVVKDIIHFLGESKCIKTTDGKTFLKFVKTVKDLEDGQIYRDIKIRARNGRKARIETGTVIKSQQNHLIDCSLRPNRRSFGAGTEIISFS